MTTEYLIFWIGFFAGMVASLIVHGVMALSWKWNSRLPPDLPYRGKLWDNEP